MSSSSFRSANQPRPNLNTNWQDRLKAHCQVYAKHREGYAMYSDRRGGRTAYSCVVTVDGKSWQARYWYGGENENNAKEDAAEVALKEIGVVGPLPNPEAAQQQQQGQHQTQQSHSGHHSSSSSSGRSSQSGSSGHHHHSSSSRR